MAENEISGSTAMAIPEDHPVQSFVSKEASEDRLWSTASTNGWPSELFQKGYAVGGSARSLMRLSIALACMDVLAQDIAKSGIQLRRYLKGRRGSEIVPAGEHPVARLLDRRPSRYYGWNEFTAIMVRFLACSSEYFAAVRRNGQNDVVEVQGMDKSRVQPQVNPDARRYFYDVTAGSLHERAQFGWAEGRRSEDEIAHIRMRSLNGIDMMGTEKVAATAFDMLSKMHAYQKNVFAGGGMGAMAFLFPDKMTEPQFERLKDDLRYMREKAMSEGRPFILEGNGAKENGMPKVVPLGMSSVDADFIKANEASAITVCQAFRVPPHKVFLLNSVKYDNQDTQNRQYVEDTLVPYLRAICECLEVVMLTEAEREDYCLAFDMDAIAGMDPATKHKMVMEQWKSGMLEFDEMREGIGKNASGDAKVGRARMFSANFTLVDEKNEVILSAGGKAPGEEGADAPQDNAGDPKKPSKAADNVIQLAR